VEAVREAERHVTFGAHRLPDAARELAPKGAIHILTFDPEDLWEFLNTAWLENHSTRYLTASLPARTLANVGARVLDEFGSLRGLLKSQPRPGLEPEWFLSCARIEDEGWDWRQFLRPWLVPAIGSETRGSPAPTRYVWEGNRSSLALAIGVRAGWISPQPFEVVECRDRPTP
jgi:hypothetical protein